MAVKRKYSLSKDTVFLENFRHANMGYEPVGLVGGRPLAGGWCLVNVVSEERGTGVGTLPVEEPMLVGYPSGKRLCFMEKAPGAYVGRFRPEGAPDGHLSGVEVNPDTGSVRFQHSPLDVRLAEGLRRQYPGKNYIFSYDLKGSDYRVVWYEDKQSWSVFAPGEWVTCSVPLLCDRKGGRFASREAGGVYVFPESGDDRLWVFVDRDNRRCEGVFRMGPEECDRLFRSLDCRASLLVDWFDLRDGGRHVGPDEKDFYASLRRIRLNPFDRKDAEASSEAERAFSAFGSDKRYNVVFWGVRQGMVSSGDVRAACEDLRMQKTVRRGRSGGAGM